MSRRRSATRALAVSLGFACAAPALAESLIERDFVRQQSALDSSWVLGLAHDGGCSVMARSRSQGGATAVVSVSWAEDNGFQLSLAPDVWSRIKTASIESVGTNHSYSFPDSPVRTLTGDAVVKLRQDISGGRTLRLSEQLSGGRSERFDFPVANGAMAMAALDACAESWKAHPAAYLPKPDGGQHIVHAQNYESSCRLQGLWPFGSEAIWLVFEVARDDATAEVHRMSSLTTPSGTVDLRELGGDVMRFKEEEVMHVPAESVVALAKNLQAGETKHVRLELTGEKAGILELGGPVARAPASMFSVCLAFLAGKPAAP